MRLLDLFIIEGKEQRQSWFNKIKSKHIDFVLCSNDYCCPKILVELDDSSHDKKAREKRDAFVNQVAECAFIPLLRIRQYTAETLENEIKKLYTVPEILNANF